MIARILLAVDDSADSFAAARIAVHLAEELGARLRVLHVSRDHVLTEAIDSATSHPQAAERRASGASALLNRMADLAAAGGVDAETDLRTGETARAVLDTAHEWAADLIVLGRAAHHVSGAPYVGAETRHVLEFAEQPVLVVPRLRRS